MARKHNTPAKKTSRNQKEPQLGQQLLSIDRIDYLITSVDVDSSDPELNGALPWSKASRKLLLKFFEIRRHSSDTVRLSCVPTSYRIICEIGGTCEELEGFCSLCAWFKWWPFCGNPWFHFEPCEDEWKFGYIGLARNVAAMGFWSRCWARLWLC